MKATRVALTFAAIACSTPAALAQAPVDQPRFEIASIRPNTTNDTRSSWRLPPQGQVAFVNATLRSIIARAYGIDFRQEPHLLLGGSSDILSARFDITAKPPDGAPAGQQLGMLRTLLAERFKLRIRQEQRDMPVFELRLARADGNVGPHLRPSVHNCRDMGPARPPRDVCDSNVLRSATESNRLGTPLIVAQVIKDAGPFTELLLDIQGFLDRPIVDATGLTGAFEWQITAAVPGTADSDYPLITKAVEEQLGLKLQPTRGAVDVWVIDSVERPTPD